MTSAKKDVVQFAIEYAEKWERKGYKPTRMSCRRFLSRFRGAWRNRRTGKRIPKVTKEQRAEYQKIWDWMMRLPKAKGKKGPVVPLGWQAMMFLYAFGPDLGVKKISPITLVLIPRKVGKTDFSARLMLAKMKFTKNAQSKCYSIATKDDQSKLSLDDGKSMIAQKATSGKYRASKRFIDRWDYFEPRADKIIRRRGGTATWELLGGKSNTLDGLAFTMCLIDEASQVHDSIYRVLSSGMSDSVEGIIVGISTAGKEPSNWFSQMIFEFIDLIEAGEEAECNVLAWAVPEDVPNDPAPEFRYPADVGKVSTWKRVTPDLGVTISIRTIKKRYNEDKMTSAGLAEFCRTRLNYYIAADSNALAKPVLIKKTVNSKHDAIVERKLKECKSYIGFDIGLKWDPCGVSVVAYDEGIIYGKTLNFMCQQAYYIKTQKMRAKVLEGFKNEGHLIVCGDDEVDFEVIGAYVQNLYDIYECDALFTDIATKGRSFRTEVREHIGIRVFDYAGGAKKGEKVIMSKNWFLDHFYKGRIKIAYNPMLRWEINNSVLVELPGGKRDIQRFEKSPETARSIDGVYALIHGTYPWSIVEQQSKKRRPEPGTPEREKWLETLGA